MDIKSKVTEPGQLMIDTCCGTFATTKACLMLLEHAALVGCEKDPDCFEAALVSLIEVHALQTISPDSDTGGIRDVKVADRAFIHSVKKILSKKRKNTWSVRDGLPHVQMLPLHIRHFLGNITRIHR